MDITEIQVNINSLKRDSNNVKEKNDDIKKQIDEIQNSMTKLGNMWEGSAKEAFMKSFQNDLEQLETLFEEIEEIYNYEVFAKDTYVNCENKVEELIKSIKI